MLTLLLFGLLAVLSSCNLRENEEEISKQLQLCKNLANNGDCDADCMGFSSFETDDCKNVYLEEHKYKIIVNAHPFMHSMESWKIVRETAEKRFYRANLTIDITEKENRNITIHCMKLIRKGNLASSSHTSEPSIFEYCPVEVNATFFVPTSEPRGHRKIANKEVAEFRNECEKKDGNRVCDPMCRGEIFVFKSYGFEEADCKNEELFWNHAVDVPVFMTKQDLNKPERIWKLKTEASFRKKFNTQVTNMDFFGPDKNLFCTQNVKEFMMSDKKYLECYLLIFFKQSVNSTVPRDWTGWYVLNFEAFAAHSEQELDLLRLASDQHL